MKKKMIQVGTGGHGSSWCRNFLPPNVKDGLIEVVAAVDVNPDAFVNAREGLGLTDEQLYTDVDKAMDENKADFCTVVVPPWIHEEVIGKAVEHGLHILSEKPIADSLEASCRIANIVKAAGLKMGVTMSHRYDQDKTTLRNELRSGAHGDLDYLMLRFTCDSRRFGNWGDFRHEIADALMVEGAVHQLDFMADLCDSKCDTIYAQTWNPKWGEFQGDSQGLVMMHFENGTRAVYEGAQTNAVGFNSWGNDYIRAECEKSTLILDQRVLECHNHIKAEPSNNASEGGGAEIVLAERPKWSNTWLIEQFVDWMNGGEPMETNVEDNLQSVALIFSAIESSKTGQPVKVQEFLKAARKSA